MKKEIVTYYCDVCNSQIDHTTTRSLIKNTALLLVTDEGPTQRWEAGSQWQEMCSTCFSAIKLWINGEFKTRFPNCRIKKN